MACSLRLTISVRGSVFGGELLEERLVELDALDLQLLRHPRRNLPRGLQTDPRVEIVAPAQKALDQHDVLGRELVRAHADGARRRWTRGGQRLRAFVHDERAGGE